MRRRAKAVNFGLIYGMSAFGLSRSTDLTLAESEDFVKAYFERFPGVWCHGDFWRETERGGNAVDFRLLEDDESVYVPSGPVLFDAPLYLDNYLDPSGTIHVRVWALPVGLPVSLCGLLAGETSRPGIDPLGDALPVIATWRLPDDYISLVARRVRAAHMWAWALTILGGIALIAGIVRV